MFNKLVYRCGSQMRPPAVLYLVFINKLYTLCLLVHLEKSQKTTQTATIDLILAFYYLSNSHLNDCNVPLGVANLDKSRTRSKTLQVNVNELRSQQFVNGQSTI